MKILLIVILALVLLYIYLILPGFTKRNEVQRFKGRNYAHRGLYNNNEGIPENSLLAFSRAVEGGYGIELDVQLTKDEVLVVFHDEYLERMCGVKGRIEDYTFEELMNLRLDNSGEKIPRLTQVLDIVDGKVPLIIEIKIHGKNTRICEVLNERLVQYAGLYCVESFNPLAVRWYRKHNPEVVRGQLSSALNHECGKRDPAFFLVEHLLTNVFTRPDFIAYNHLYKNRLGRVVCKNLFKCFAVTWTIKSQEELEQSAKDFDIFIFEGFIP